MPEVHSIFELHSMPKTEKDSFPPLLFVYQNIMDMTTANSILQEYQAGNMFLELEQREYPFNRKKVNLRFDEKGNAYVQTVVNEANYYVDPEKQEKFNKLVKPVKTN